MVEIDTSELKGKRFRCIDGCGLCCLCQPELLPDELRTFRSDRQLVNIVVKSDYDPSKRSIAMLPGAGPCALLNERKCTIYDKRPHFCRQFPVQTHLMWRIQLTPDYSCRGIWRSGFEDGDGFTDLEQYGLRELRSYSESKLEAELSDAREVFDEFRTNAKDSGAWIEPDALRANISRLIGSGHFSSIISLGGILSSVEKARSTGQDVMHILGSAGPGESEAAARKAIDELSEEVLQPGELRDSPIYVDSALNWNVFTSRNGGIERMHLLDSGGTKGAGTVNLNRKGIALAQGADRALSEYAEVSNRRDGFLGFIYYLVDDADYETDILSTYLENLAMTQLDLVFRSAVVSSHSAGSIGYGEITEGIVYMDMDMHDAPTIGSII